MTQQPSYYSILPAIVRYSKNLTFFQKILFSEITALANKDGYCSAGNGYFAEIYGMEEETISRAISKLAKEGTIKVFINKEAGNKRRIYPCDQVTLLTNLSIPIDKKVNTPIDKKVNIIIQEYNNTRVNNLSTNVESAKSKIDYLKTDELKTTLKKTFPAVGVDMEIETAIDWLKSTGKRYKNYESFMRNWCRREQKRLLELAKKNGTAYTPPVIDTTRPDNAVPRNNMNLV
jgi:hypothetical protein